MGDFHKTPPQGEVTPSFASLEPESDTETRPASETPSETRVFDETRPGDEAKPPGGTKPTTETKPPDGTKFPTGAKSSRDSQSATETKSAETRSSAEAPALEVKPPIRPRRDPYTMTEAELIRRSKHRERGRLWTQVYAVFIGCLSSIMFGASLGWSSPAFRVRVEHEQYTAIDASWIASMLPIGICVGCIGGSYLKNTTGPRKVMMLTKPVQIVLWIVLSFNIYPSMYMAARFFNGFICICELLSGESLMVESIHHDYHKIAITLFRSSSYLGVVIVYMSGMYLQFMLYTLMIAAIGMLHYVCLLSIPESPVHLYNKSEYFAIQSLEFYRGQRNLAMDVRNLRRDHDFLNVDPDANRYMLYSKVCVKGITIVCVLCIFQVFSGHYAFIFYNMIIWQDYGQYSISNMADSLIFGISLFLFSLVFNYYQYSTPWGVRRTLSLSLMCITVNLFMCTGYCYCWDNGFRFFIRYTSWLPLVLVVINVVAYEMGLANIPEKMLYDYMPYQVYPRARTIFLFVHWALVATLVRSFRAMSVSISFTLSFFICACFAFIGVLYVQEFVIETKNKTLVQIQTDLGGNPIGSRGAFRSRTERMLLSV